MARMSVHDPDHAQYRKTVQLNGEIRHLFDVPSSNPKQQPYTFVCGPQGAAPWCSCMTRYAERQAPCALIKRAGEVATKVPARWR